MADLTGVWSYENNLDMRSTTPYQTGGGFRSEQAACESFDAWATKWRDMFEIYSEMQGQIAQPKLGCKQSSARIDRVLIPRLDCNLSCGAIGVEIKRSGVNLGPVISQCQDYLRCLFCTQNGVHVALGGVFIFMVDEYPLGNVASIMEQSRVGAIDFKYGLLRFRMGKTALAFSSDGKLVEAADTNNGYKMGSR